MEKNEDFEMSNVIKTKKTRQCKRNTSIKSKEQKMRKLESDESDSFEGPESEEMFSKTITLNEEEINIAEKFADTRQTLADAAKACVCGILWGGVSSVHAEYKKRAPAIGVPALKLEEFWHKFRRRFHGTYWGYANYGTDEQVSIGRAVFVVLRPEDKSLFSLIDKFGWFQSGGEDAVLDAFIETQDSFSGEPHPEDEIETATPVDFRGIKLGRRNVLKMG